MLVPVIKVINETNGNITKKVMFIMNMISYLELVLTQVLTVLSLMMVLLLRALVNIIKIKAGLMVDLIIGMIEIIMALLILMTEFIGIQKVKQPIIGDSHL